MQDSGVSETSEIRPKTREEVAMDKVAELAQIICKDSGAFSHGTPPENLGKILREGIVSESFAKRTGKTDFKSRFTSFGWNKRYVSVMKDSVGKGEEFVYSNRDIIILVRPDSRAIPVDEDLKISEVRPIPNEFVIPIRIAPRELLGVCVQKWSDTNEFTLNPEIIIEEIKSLEPEAALPVYDVEGNLIWPQSLTREQVAKMPTAYSK